MHRQEIAIIGLLLILVLWTISPEAAVVTEFIAEFITTFS